MKNIDDWITSYFEKTKVVLPYGPDYSTMMKDAFEAGSRSSEQRITELESQLKDSHINCDELESGVKELKRIIIAMEGENQRVSKLLEKKNDAQYNKVVDEAGFDMGGGIER